MYKSLTACLSLFPFFTEQKLQELWRCDNATTYLKLAPSLRLGKSVMKDALPLSGYPYYDRDDMSADMQSNLNQF